MVYIQEAHSVDVWPIGLPDPVLSTHNQHDRIANARHMTTRSTHFSYDVYVEDPKHDGLSRLLRPWPIRAFVVTPLSDGNCRLDFTTRDGIFDASKFVSELEQYLLVLSQ